ncbi:hypothetical protein AAF712_013311 [Marasmius tenuissimus]|uniref:F-box domain protein n=1 Tax=Marasmius tenuissimus TaxID=585030 RepID=A0ABR2ZG14_9AGAR
MIFELLPADDRLALASASSHLRNVLAPHIFSGGLRIDSTAQGRQEFEQLTNKYGSLITYLHFVVSAPHGGPEAATPTPRSDHGTNEQDAHISAEDLDNLGSGDPKSQSYMTGLAQDALTGKLLPNVTTVCLSFDFDFESDYVWDDPESFGFVWSIYVFKESEADHDVSRKEAKYPWRALMAQTWSALCRNHDITELTVLNLIPRKTTTFDSDDWRDFLGRLDTLRLRMWGGDNGVGWAAHSTAGYAEFGTKLGEYFFQHLNQVQWLLFSGYPTCPLGGNLVKNLDLSKEHLPHLRILQLCNVFINKRLTNFILGKSAPVQVVELRNCHVNTDDFEEPSWAEFFAHLRRNEYQLRELLITYDRGDPGILFQENPIEKQDEGDKVFSYGYLDDKYAFYIPEDEAIREKYEERRDLNEYRRLIDLVERNQGDCDKTSLTREDWLESLLN